MKKILALDFDGVIWDSVGECFVMARRAYQNLYGLPCADLEAPFRRGRWLVRTGGDFLLILQLAMQDPDGDLSNYSKSDFARLQKEKASECAEFETEFYGLRRKCRDENWGEWVSYQKPYPLFLEQLKDLRTYFDEVVVCTTKDSRSAQLLLESADLDFAIWGKENGVDKGQQIADICSQRQVTAQQIYFIDDLVENLEQVAPSGAGCGLAVWGYNTPLERQHAQEAGYTLLEVYSVAKDLRALIGQGCPSPG